MSLVSSFVLSLNSFAIHYITPQPQYLFSFARDSSFCYFSLPLLLLSSASFSLTLSSSFPFALVNFVSFLLLLYFFPLFFLLIAHLLHLLSPYLSCLILSFFLPPLSLFVSTLNSLHPPQFKYRGHFLPISPGARRAPRFAARRKVPVWAAVSAVISV